MGSQTIRHNRATDHACTHTWLLLLFCCLVVSDSLQPLGLQHARFPCPSLSLRLLKSTSIESVILTNHLILCCLLLLLPSNFPSIRDFSNELALCISGQSIGASTLASFLPRNTQGLFPLGLICLISLQSKGLSRVFQHNSKVSILQCSAFFMVQLSHPCMGQCGNHSVMSNFATPWPVAQKTPLFM